MDCVRAAFWHLYQFSKGTPGVLALMFVDRSVPRITHMRERLRLDHAKGRQTGLIQQAIDAGEIPKGSGLPTGLPSQHRDLGVADRCAVQSLSPDEDRRARARLPWRRPGRPPRGDSHTYSLEAAAERLLPARSSMYPPLSLLASALRRLGAGGATACGSGGSHRAPQRHCGADGLDRWSSSYRSIASFA